MTDIENTSRRDPAVHLLGGAIDGADGYIVRMESAGQTQVVASDRLPTLAPGSTDADLVALGITLGEPDPDDPLFRAVTLPPGWSRQASDHPLYTYVVDQHGRHRLGIFYKAAFYDRRADLTVYTVSKYAADLVYEDGTPLVTDEWATGDALIAVVERIRSRAAQDLELSPGSADCARRLARCDEVITRIREYLAATASGGEVSGEGGEGSG